MTLTSLLAHPRLKPVALENVRVAAPCPASWEVMAGDERVRFCAECKLNVYNLSEMTRREAERLIATHEGRLCVRFYRRADGTIITQNCPRGLRVLIQRVSRVAGAVLAAIMSLGFAVAQAPQEGTCPEQATKEPLSEGIYLVLVDPQLAVIPGARVTMTDSKNTKTWNARSDANGAVTFGGLVPGVYTVKVEVPGFKSMHRKIRIEKNKITTRTWKMKLGGSTTTVTVGMVAEPTVAPPLGSPPPSILIGKPAPVRD